MDKYELDRPEWLTDDEWEELCGWLDNGLDHFLSQLEQEDN
jgi:hypothetical protein